MIIFAYHFRHRKTIDFIQRCYDYGYKIREYQCQDIKGKNINKVLKNTINYTNILDCFNGIKKDIYYLLN